MSLKDSISVLGEIIHHKHQELIALNKLVNESLINDLRPSTKSLFNALNKDFASFIMEYKKSSPSKGVINNILSIDECVEAYSGVADAISVLTDRKYFGGSFDTLKEFSAKVTLPILCKDFIISKSQIYLARSNGADAILLMLSVLDDRQYLELRECANAYNMDVLTEVHTEEETRRALAMNAKIIGINNRNLKDLSIDLTTTERLAPMIPENVLLISESGISSRADASRLSRCVDAFLIGSSLMAASSVKQAAIEMVFGRVKICGVNSGLTVKYCLTHGASLVGLMLYSGSKRAVMAEQIQKIMQELSQVEIERIVAVFVDEPIEQLIQVIKKTGIKNIQLHGVESKEYVEKLKLVAKEQLAFPITIIKALPDPVVQNPNLANAWLKIVDKILIDTAQSGQFGGSGKQFEWSLLNCFLQHVDAKRVFIAGGVSEQNVGDLLPLNVGVDLSSSVETQDCFGNSLYIKSHKKIAALMNKTRLKNRKSKNNLE